MQKTTAIPSVSMPLLEKVITKFNKDLNTTFNVERKQKKPP